MAEQEKQNSNPEEDHPNNLIEKLSMYTETICKKIEITKEFFRGNSALFASSMVLSYMAFSKDDQVVGFVFAGISCTFALALTLGLTILSKQQKYN